MRIVTEHPDLRRQYEQIVACATHLSFFSQLWVQDALHLHWAYVLNDANQILLRIPFAPKLGIKAYLQPLFIRELELVANLDTAQCNKIVSFLQKQLFLHLNISLNRTDILVQQTGKFQKLKLASDIEKLRAGYSENLKRNLKKVHDLKIEEISYATFQSFFIKQKGEGLGNLNSAAWLRLEKLAAAAAKKESLYCYGTYKEEELVAVGLFFKWNAQLYFMKGTLNDQGKKSGALVFLIDSIIEKFSRDFSTLDFIGSNQESIAAFYRKFGAIDQAYGIVKGKIPLV
ncbi:MAG: hypothetical protein FJ349_08635 [Sphingomonadales bacterium]|nr:hypothetical protein [Sphingomonadales bacterium]